MPIDDFEVQREPALKGSITSTHAPKEGREAGATESPGTQPEGQPGQHSVEDNGVISWPSVRNTESGSPAAIEASVPRSVSTESILGKRPFAGVDLSGFHMVKKKGHKNTYSINSARLSPYERGPDGGGARPRRLSTS